MQQSHSGLSDLTRHYVQASLAGGVLLAVARCRRDGTLKDEDREVLRRAADFLQELEDGEAFRSGARISARLLQGGISLEETLSAIPEHAAADVSGYLATLRKFIDDLLARPEASRSDPRFERLHDFMKGYGNLQRNLIAESLGARHRPGASIPIG